MKDLAVAALRPPRLCFSMKPHDPSDAPRSDAHRIRYLLAIAAVAGVIALLSIHRLDAADVCGANEAVEGVFLQQMVEHGALLFPVENGRAPMYKPPLFHWTATALDRAAGIKKVTSFNLRITSALYATAGALLTMVFAYSVLGPSAAVLSGLILAASYQFIEEARIGRVARLERSIDGATHAHQRDPLSLRDGFGTRRACQGSRRRDSSRARMRHFLNRRASAPRLARARNAGPGNSRTRRRLELVRRMSPRPTLRFPEPANRQRKLRTLLRRARLDGALVLRQAASSELRAAQPPRTDRGLRRASNLLDLSA